MVTHTLLSTALSLTSKKVAHMLCISGSRENSIVNFLVKSCSGNSLHHDRVILGMVERFYIREALSIKVL